MVAVTLVRQGTTSFPVINSVTSPSLYAQMIQSFIFPHPVGGAYLKDSVTDVVLVGPKLRSLLPLIGVSTPAVDTPLIVLEQEISPVGTGRLFFQVIVYSAAVAGLQAKIEVIIENAAVAIVFFIVVLSFLSTVGLQACRQRLLPTAVRVLGLNAGRIGAEQSAEFFQVVHRKIKRDNCGAIVIPALVLSVKPEA